MAAVLVGLAVMAVVMSALLPVWRQQAQREKEAELLFRGAQYARAINLFRAKNGNNFPPSIDILVQQKYLRKKYKDPITNDDFQPLFVGQQPGGQQPGGQQGRGGLSQPGPARGLPPPGLPSLGLPPPGLPPSGVPAAGSRGTSPGARGAQPPGAFGAPGAQQGGQFQGGGITAIVSKSKETSIRNHRGATTYNQWQFNPLDDIAGPGAPAQGRGGPAGQPGMGQPGRGGTPPVGPRIR